MAGVYAAGRAKARAIGEGRAVDSRRLAGRKTLEADMVTGIDERRIGDEEARASRWFELGEGELVESCWTAAGKFKEVRKKLAHARSTIPKSQQSISPSPPAGLRSQSAKTRQSTDINHVFY